MKTGAIVLLAVVLLTILFAGFGQNTDRSDIMTESHTEEYSQTAIRTDFSKLEIQNMFLDYAESGWVVVDCIPVTDSDYGIIGVVQYTTCDDNGCKFDFLKLDGPMRVGIGAQPAGEDRLVYIGADTVSCELMKNDGEIYTCSVSYYETGTEIGFNISE